MATLPTKSFNQIVTDTVSGIQGRASKLLNFSQGSTFRAVAEGFAGTFLWFQALALEVLKASRLSTSSNVDVDTFTADYMPTVGISNGVPSPRLGAQAASGQVTFARFTAAPSTCFVPVGATVRTNDSAQTQFTVTADVMFAYFDPVLNGYTLPANLASMIVPVQAVVAGASGNVKAGSITVMTSPITGIDTVINVADFINGVDQELDSQLKKRFSDFILGLARGDLFGLNASIEGSGVNVQYAVTEGYNLDGSYHPGYFFVVADDGSGNPTNAFLTTVTLAAQAVRPLGIMCGVFGPQITLATVSMQIGTADGFDHNTVAAQVAAVVGTNINQLGLGNPLPWSIIASWAYSVPGVTSVADVLLNGLYGDGASLSPTAVTDDLTLTYVIGTIKANEVIVS
ncbi:baseplate J/gp47 family protein [Bradyrhizobium septentrionale]|uniref:Baseplate J/gp47 family protein n=1 Tax=Bradyrhizobium septentrionale TaxID=1404411 RepID=A0A973W373_9BRAD|nr:baseplate J/gp47 family protein [Bradyrhizobium septentrionale]UGY15103.1 baseplate J/gp47 family protein [Bradyrhizobium septentrionale]